MNSTEVSAVQFGRTTIEYHVRRSRRRHTVAVSIHPEVGVLLTAPTDVPLSRLNAVVHRKARWILERLQRVNHIERHLPAREFVSGESYRYLGRSYRLKVVPKARAGHPVLVGGWLRVPVHAVNGSDCTVAVRRSLESWYREHAALRLPERVAQWAPVVGVAEPRVVIRGQQRRWASCDARGVVRFNWRIIQAPMRLVDYVVVHELTHLKHEDHARQFWASLGRTLPDYDRRREELRRVGATLEW
jgi:predicted metal-dependent hydrolase